jgi:hypothetical protein
MVYGLWFFVLVFNYFMGWVKGKTKNKNDDGGCTFFAE